MKFVVGNWYLLNIPSKDADVIKKLPANILPFNGQRVKYVGRPKPSIVSFNGVLRRLYTIKTRTMIQFTALGTWLTPIVSKEPVKVETVSSATSYDAPCSCTSIELIGMGHKVGCAADRSKIRGL